MPPDPQKSNKFHNTPIEVTPSNMWNRLVSSILLFCLASAYHIPENTTPNNRRSISKNEKLVDSRISFSTHPLLSFAPVPKTAAEIEAAKNPDYIKWVAEKSKNRHAKRFETAEHAYLGDCLVLQGPDGTTLPPLSRFTLPNGLNLTYGEINCLGGDFYGTYNPISDGADLPTQVQLFLNAYNLLAQDSRAAWEAIAILAADKEERDKFAEAVANGTDPSVVYSTLSDLTLTLENITITRPLDEPGYLGLAAINFDHFGADARKAYNAGHYAAIQVAIGGKPEDLLTAYTLNAFADHFLEDSFASGHLRTPRRVLHDTVLGGFADICSKLMHDEDNSIGLQVSNPAGATWTAYGDKRLMDHSDQDNANHALNALRISTGEIYQAWSTKTAPDPSTYGAWLEAPTLESAQGPQQLAPLFTAEGQRRNNIEDRHTWDFTSFFTYATTVAECELSGLWNYPIIMT